MKIIEFIFFLSCVKNIFWEKDRVYFKEIMAVLNK